MGFIIFVLSVAVLGGIIYARILSSRAQKRRDFSVRLPEGATVQDFINAAFRDLPPKWGPVGSKKAHFTVLKEWDSENCGGNVLNIATGNILSGIFVLSVEMDFEDIDEYGRPVTIGFDEAPPRNLYDAHVWVSYAQKGMGRMWSPLTSKAILETVTRLEECSVSIRTKR